MSDDAIFLDAHATTPMDPAVLETMIPWMRVPANSHSSHAIGRDASVAIEHARTQVADLIGAEPAEIVFVPSATVAANVALRSFALPGSLAIRSAIEHPCVAETLDALRPAVSVAIVPVTGEGLIEPDDLEEAVEGGASVVAVMAVNNEVGTIQPIDEIGRLCEYMSIPFFVDLAQAAGRVRVDVRADRVSAGAISSHKLYGPQGVGALYCRRDLFGLMRPIANGGGQESGLSPGTLPTALCVGFGEACAIAAQGMAVEAERIAMLRDRLLALLLEEIPGLYVNGSLSHRVPNNLNVSFPGVDADELLAHTPGLIASTGSACSSGAIAPSPVLKAMGLSADRIAGAVRFGVGRHTTVDQIDRAAALVIHALKALTTAVRP